MDDSGGDTGSTLFQHFGVPDYWNGLSAREQFRFALRRPFATGATMLLTGDLVQAASPIPKGWLHDRWFSLIGCASGGGQADGNHWFGTREHSDQVVGLSSKDSHRRIVNLLLSGKPITMQLKKYASLRKRLRRLDIAAEVLNELSPPWWLLDRE